MLIGLACFINCDGGSIQLDVKEGALFFLELAN
jgi:hypothetical protein